MAVVLAMSLGRASAREACETRDRRLVVLTGGERLLMCDGAKLVGGYDVHLGRGGVGKTQAGDNKVPIGIYPLGQPRKSSKFWIFIPIGYPTPAQRTKGFTGQDVGVHGPHRYLRWLGPITNLVSSTAGCIGVAKDEQIEAISAWVRAMKVRTIEIR